VISLCRDPGRSVLVFTFTLLIWGIVDDPRALAENKAAKRFPKVTLKTQDGEKVEFYNNLIKDKIVIINMMYTQCTGLCEQTTEKLVQVQKALGDRLGREVFIYSITLDPEHDTPEVLKKYAKAHGVKPGWSFLTGNADDITALRRSLGLDNLDPSLRAKLGLRNQEPAADTRQRQHSGMIVIGYDPFNKWDKVAIQSTPEQILQIIERMKPPSRAQE
jgi:protein SCO1